MQRNAQPLTGLAFLCPSEFPVCKMKPSPIQLPEFIDPEIWDAFLERREATKKQHPFTPKAQALLIGRIIKMHSEGWDMNEALGTAAINGWLTVYPKIKRAAFTPEEIQKRIQDERIALATKPPPEIAALFASLKLKKV